MSNALAAAFWGRDRTGPEFDEPERTGATSHVNGLVIVSGSGGADPEAAAADPPRLSLSVAPPGPSAASPNDASFNNESSDSAAGTASASAPEPPAAASTASSSNSAADFDPHKFAAEFAARFAAQFAAQQAGGAGALAAPIPAPAAPPSSVPEIPLSPREEPVEARSTADEAPAAFSLADEPQALPYDMEATAFAEAPSPEVWMPPALSEAPVSDAWAPAPEARTFEPEPWSPPETDAPQEASSHTDVSPPAEDSPIVALLPAWSAPAEATAPVVADEAVEAAPTAAFAEEAAAIAVPAGDVPESMDVAEPVAFAAREPVETEPVWTATEEPAEFPAVAAWMPALATAAEPEAMAGVSVPEALAEPENVVEIAVVAEPAAEAGPISFEAAVESVAPPPWENQAAVAFVREEEAVPFFEPPAPEAVTAEPAPAEAMTAEAAAADLPFAIAPAEETLPLAAAETASAAAEASAFSPAELEAPVPDAPTAEPVVESVPAAEVFPTPEIAPAEEFAPVAEARPEPAAEPVLAAVTPPDPAPVIAAAAAAPKAEKPSEKAAAADSPDTSSDQVYRFPHGRSGVEIVPDIGGSFCLKVLWHRGKAVLSLAESTPLRPLGRVTMNGQRYDLFFTQHARKKRDRVLLAGKRKVALRERKAALRYVVSLTGREDRYTWRWRVAANTAALAVMPSEEEQASLPPDEVRLYLPFAPGKARVLSLPGAVPGYALWLNDVALTVVGGPCEGGATSRPELTYDEKGFCFTLNGARLGEEGASLEWEMWLSAARTEAEARSALLRHLADSADRLQEIRPASPETARTPLKDVIERAEAALMAEDIVEKRGVDRIAYRMAPIGGKEATGVGETVDAALIGAALLGRFYQTGDDALRRRARLLANGLCSFQVNEEESPHWGALWDTVVGKGGNVSYQDVHGEKTLSVATTARAAKGLQLLHAHFDVELYKRTALAATQWLILKMDRDGRINAERFTEEGPPHGGETDSPWVVGEALLPLVETFRVTENEVFLKAALRAVAVYKEGLRDSTLPFELATTEQLASAIEGILLVSREYEKDDIVSLARQLGLGLRARRQPDGSLADPPTAAAISPLVPTLAGARAALALSRVDDDPLWLTFAFRALRAADRQAQELTAAGGAVQLADQAQQLTLSCALLLAVAARGKGCVADKDRVTITRGWQTFAPDPATREFVQVVGLDENGSETAVDYLALVCPVSLQVMVAVLAAPSVTEVKVVKNGKTPFLRNLLTGDVDLKAPLLPLGDGQDAHVGVFLADT